MLKTDDEQFTLTTKTRTHHEMR